MTILYPVPGMVGEHLRWCVFVLASGLVCTVSDDVAAQTDRQFAVARMRMVQEEIIEAGVEDARVIESMRTTPRHLFVSSTQRPHAYLDMALPIGHGQTISPPFIVASMTEAIRPQPTDRVLEIGTGSGYQAAVLSPLVAEVYSIEIVEPLGNRAAQTLQRLKYSNVFTRVGDGFQGWPEKAPFDKIIVTCSPEKIPPALVAQLKEGGRMVIPLGERYQQTLYLLEKKDGKLETQPLEPTFFVPMTGRAEEIRVIKDESGIPKLLNASFELQNDDQTLAGWYYVRQAEVVEGPEASDGSHYLRFQNETPGRGAQALQAVGVDGRRIRSLRISLTLATTGVRPGQTSHQLPRVEISFFDDKQAPAGADVVGPWYGTSSWSRKQATIQVPPRARLAVVAIGMFGACGEFACDDLRLDVAEERESR